MPNDMIVAKRNRDGLIAVGRGLSEFVDDQDRLDIDIIGAAVSLLNDILDWRDAHAHCSWEKEFYEIGEGSDFIFGRPQLNSRHVQLLIRSGLVQRCPMGDYSGLRILLSQEDRVRQLIKAYVSTLEAQRKAE